MSKIILQNFGTVSICSVGTATAGSKTSYFSVLFDADIGGTIDRQKYRWCFAVTNVCEAILLYNRRISFVALIRGTKQVSQDGTAENWGVSIEDVMERANEAHPNIRSTIIIMDCCHSGIAGEVNALEHQVRASLIGNGVTILAACHRDELAVESSGQGRFTQVLLEGLRGGASDVLGEITPASLYAYVDQALGAWEQRPVYKANVQQFTNILTEAPKVRIETLRKLPVYFPYVEHKFQLDPSFEPDRGEETKQLQDIAVNPSNVQIYREMQSCNRYGLITPTDYPQHVAFCCI